LAELGEVLGRARRILTELELLAEGDTAALDRDRVAHSSSESRDPPRVDSLREKYLKRLDDLCHDAEADLARYRFGAPPTRRLESDEDFATRVVHQYTGRHARFAADLEGVRQIVIERARRLFGRDPTFGL
jgi:hypothetical protein